MEAGGKKVNLQKGKGSGLKKGATGFLTLPDGPSHARSRHASTSTTIPVYTEKQAEELTNDAKLHLLETNSPDERKLPNWMRQYRLASYIIYGLGSLFSIFYLIFVGVYQADPRMQIQYEEIVKYLEYNSYSILSPLLCPVIMGMLAYNIHKRTRLDEGDFFGLLGFLLFFALVNFHDGYGIYQLGTAVKDDKPETPDIRDPPQENLASENELHWQYAWSTKPRCAKKYVRGIIYRHNYDKKHVDREILVEPAGRDHTSLLNPKFQSLDVYFDNSTTTSPEDGEKTTEESGGEGEATFPPGLATTAEPDDKVDISTEITAEMGLTSSPSPDIPKNLELVCDKFNDIKEIAEIRQWMQDVQEQFKCCGPYGYSAWQNKFISPEKTGCKVEWIKEEDKDREEIHGCYAPLMKWLDEICMNTFWVMIVQGIIYIICMGLALLHHTAMKLEEEVVVKQYSLLNLNEEKGPDDPWWREKRPSDKPPIVGTYQPNLLIDENGAGNGDLRDNSSTLSTSSHRKRKKHHQHHKDSHQHHRKNHKDHGKHKPADTHSNHSHGSVASIRSSHHAKIKF